MRGLIAATLLLMACTTTPTALPTTDPLAFQSGEATALVKSWLSIRAWRVYNLEWSPVTQYCLEYHGSNGQGPFVEQKLSGGKWWVTHNTGGTYKWEVSESSQAVKQVEKPTGLEC